MRIKYGMKIRYYSHRPIMLKSFYYYMNGKKNGEYKAWYDNGVLSKHFYYIKNHLNGEYITYARDGAIDISVLYKNDEIIKIITGVI